MKRTKLEKIQAKATPVATPIQHNKQQSAPQGKRV